MIVYGWPVAEKDLEGFSRFESPAHILVPRLRFSCDFIVGLETEVLAMADGIVRFVKDDSKKGGDDRPENPENSRFWNLGNRIEIEHDGEFTGYEHLAFRGSRLAVGDEVKRGDVIAVTGYMAHLGPHLHVERLKYHGKSDEDFQTLMIHWERFDDLLKFLWDHDRWREIGDSRRI